ncbi:hypothetical protein DSM112329_00494 [Paraconexibacter sp. AEG42_29]|uniref:NlpC/P60 domain-containing protein n=1 Tax=Paraconexibacter sp. AEG42_29 TaxID=2997339 RepID=A0AAU7APS2_9ACTN
MPGPRRTLTTLAVTACCTVAAGAGAPTASADRVSDKAVSWGLSQVGTREDGTTNCSSKLNAWSRNMRLNVPPCRPWCGAFVHEAFRRAGVDLSPRLIDPTRTERDAAAGQRGLFTIAKSDVRPGDLLLFALHRGQSTASHIALVTSRPSGGSVRTVEGNVAHAVRKKTRGLRYAVMAVRVRR